MIEGNVSQEELTEEVKGLENYNLGILIFLLAPIVLTSLIMTFTRNFYAPFGSHLIYALSNWITLLFLFVLLKRKDLAKKVFLFSKLSLREIIAAVITFLIGVFVIFPVTELINSSLGLAMQGMNYQITNNLELITVLFFAVITAPIAEEILFRGLGIGYLLAKGFSPILAGGLVIILFALIHIPYFGLGGAIFISLWSILPTYLRIKYNSLTPGWLMHVFNNIFAYIIVVLFL